MRRIILTGAPGAGKTALLRRLEIAGYGVVEEAASDVIALAHARGLDAPHEQPSFCDDILHLQRQREWLAGLAPAQITFSDRSPICTYALAEYLGRSASPALETEVARIVRHGPYEKRVMFLGNLGFIEPTAARRISFEETLKFEQVHVDVYRRFGFELVMVAKDSVEARFAYVVARVAEA